MNAPGAAVDRSTTGDPLTDADSRLHHEENPDLLISPAGRWFSLHVLLPKNTKN